MKKNNDEKNSVVDAIARLQKRDFSPAGVYRDFFKADKEAETAAKKADLLSLDESFKNADYYTGKSDIKGTETRAADAAAKDADTAEKSVNSTEEALRHAREALLDAAHVFDIEGGEKKTGASGKLKVSGDSDDKSGREDKEADPGRNSETADENAADGEKPEEPETDPMEELDSLIGLDEIKKDVRELADFASVQKARRDQGLKSVPVSLHLVFTGNPGTGKTTVARILARIYKKIGILSKGQLVETDRAGLVAGYVGQTAIKTSKQIEKAMGGILFIDEAYTLSQKDDAFGQEAIDTILKAMEDHRNDLVVIVAGYTELMEDFINSNPGLKSRFNKYIEFPDYTIDELEKIFYLNCDKYDYKVDDEAKPRIRELIEQRKNAHAEHFGNAREVRNLFETIITNQARRVAALENPTHEDMMLIIKDDME